MSVVLVLNPTKVDSVSALERMVGHACRERGLPTPLTLQTTREDPGEQLVRRAVEQGAELVLSAGGDGTVMAVARGLARTGVPLGLLPLGTGNLLARNLDLPLELEAALDVALDGTDRQLDLGMLSTGPPAPAQVFAVMAGIGFDAAMMADAPERLKSVAGWAAYLVSGARHLRDRPMQVELTVDDAEPMRCTARSVVIGNVGMLQGGLHLLPDALPDDGLLDVVVLSPLLLRDWVRVMARLAVRRPSVDRDIEHLQGRCITVHATSPQPLQLDGDPSGTADLLRVELQPAALLVRVSR